MTVGHQSKENLIRSVTASSTVDTGSSQQKTDGRPKWEFNPEGGALEGCRARSEWRAKWRARSSLISTAEAAQPPSEVVDDAETEDEPTISLAA